MTKTKEKGKVGRKFTCSPIFKGSANGPALVSDEAVCFYLVEPESGILIEQDHSLNGKSLSGTVLIAHAGKGSSVVQMDGLYKIAQTGKSPVAVVLRNPDPVFVSALLIMEIPSVYDVEEEFYHVVRDGMKITIDADAGEIRVDG